MSRDDHTPRKNLLGELARELRRINGQGASFFRAAAARHGIPATDIEVIDILNMTGPATAGRLAELTGLTTGAITQMLDRLEEKGLVRRGKDPEDGRRVIVELAAEADATREIRTLFAEVGGRWSEMAAHYDDAQLALLVAFLRQANEVTLEEVARLRATPAGAETIFSAPLGGLESGRFTVSRGILRLHLHADSAMSELYQARFEGPTPEVKNEGGTVSLRYPRRLLSLGAKMGSADVALSAAIPWRIEIQGGLGDTVAELGDLQLAEMVIDGGMANSRLELPRPSGVVPIRISGGAANITVRRPVGVGARARLKGWVSQFTFDDQSFGMVGSDVRVQSTNFDTAAPFYDIEVNSSASMVTITTG